jgi:hypothetical protein
VETGNDVTATFAGYEQDVEFRAMTVSSTTTRADYAGNGLTTTFAVPFYFLLDTDIQVSVVDNAFSPPTYQPLELNTHYTVSGAGNPAGGSITTITGPPSATEILTIARNVPYTQLTHYVPNDPFPAASHEMALDKLTMEIQQLEAFTENLVQFPPNAPPGMNTVLPYPVPGDVLGWDSAGTAITNYDAVNSFNGRSGDVVLTSADITGAGGELHSNTVNSFNTRIGAVTLMQADVTGVGAVLDSPSDGTTYGRKDGGWSVVAGSGAAGSSDDYTLRWDTATTAADPGSGDVRGNNANASLITHLYVSSFDRNGLGIFGLTTLAVGSDVYLYEQNTVGASVHYTVAAAPVNNGPNVWFDVPVTLVAFNGFTPSANQLVQLYLPIKGAGASAASTSYTPNPTQAIAATNVQSAIDEVASERVKVTGDTMTGILTMSAASPQTVFAQAAAGGGNSSMIYNTVANVPRWAIVLNDAAAETGSNAGSNYGVNRYDDAGTFMDRPLAVNRATGATTLKDVFVNAINQSGANTLHYMNKAASGGQNNISGATAGIERWRITLGDATAESGSATGSDFAINRFDNAGATLGTPLTISRATGQATFAQSIYSTAAGGPPVQFGGGAATGVFADGSNIAIRTYVGSQIYFQTGGGASTLAQMLANGDFIIGGANATKASGTTWVNPSDERIKQDVKEYPVGLASISKLRPIMYKFKRETRYEEDILANTYVGLVAQEAELVMPDIVATKSFKVGDIELEDFRFLDASNITFALVNAVKELKAYIERLETRIKDLEAQLNGPIDAQRRR